MTELPRKRRRPDLSVLRRADPDDRSPRTRYAKSGDTNIAYQIVGEGSIDLVLVPGWVSHVEFAWEVPSYGSFLRALARFARVIVLDRRGTGLSDAVAELPTLEQRMEDVRAVMDAAGSLRATLFGISEGGPMCTLFAATYPERTASLVLYGTVARILAAPDYPWGFSAQEIGEFLDAIEQKWGQGITGAIFAPTAAANPEHIEQWARFERNAVSPGGARKLIAMFTDTDVRAILPTIAVPTLVLHRTEDVATPVEGGRYLAQHIRGAKYLELGGADHFAWIGDASAILTAVEEFVTGGRQRVAADRVLTTVLFTDIVDSTARAARLGDALWRATLERFYETVRRTLVAFRGIEVATTGDGVFARFDGPARAIQCACAIRDETRKLGLSVRTGLHTGECELAGDDLTGIAVHLGARVAATAGPSEVWVSSTVKDLVAGSGLRFADRGAHSLKGVPGPWRLDAVDD